jgi:hypothetical protein
LAYQAIDYAAVTQAAIPRGAADDRQVRNRTIAQQSNVRVAITNRIACTFGTTGIGSVKVLDNSAALVAASELIAATNAPMTLVRDLPRCSTR